MKILKLISFRTLDKKDSNLYLGTILSNGKILNFKSIIEEFPEFKGKLESMTQLINSGKDTVANLKKIITNSIIATKIEKLDKNEVSIQVPFQPLRNIHCIGKNYKDHINEVQNALSTKDEKAAAASNDTKPTIEIPKFPVFFSKATTSVIGHKKMIESHSKLTQYLDYEGIFLLLNTYYIFIHMYTNLHFVFIMIFQYVFTSFTKKTIYIVHFN